MRSFLLVVVLSLAGICRAGEWVYQLQNPNPRALAVSGFGAAVMDYSRDGTDATRFKPGQIRTMQRKGVEALAYFSIGEAESYRFYWDAAWVAKPDTNQFTASSPAWLGHTNPDWVGNYKVRYWDPEWRETALMPYLDRIVRQGFNGVYLDIIDDGVEYWSNPKNYGGLGKEEFRPGDPLGNEKDAARRMIELVRWVADYGRANSKFGKEFQVFPQNPDYLLRFDRGGKLLRTISGVGVEDIFYDETRRQPRWGTAYRLQTLKKVVRSGKPVLCVDYVDTGNSGDAKNEARIADFVEACERVGFEPYVARDDRELDLINRVAGVQP